MAQTSRRCGGRWGTWGRARGAVGMDLNVRQWFYPTTQPQAESSMGTAKGREQTQVCWNSSMDTPYPSALPPYEAICKWADQQLVAEMRELEDWDASPFWFFDDLEHDRKKGRYRSLREQFERWLVDRLLQGDFLSWGYDEDAPLEGIKAIPKELWRILEPQFRDEAARARSPPHHRDSCCTSRGVFGGGPGTVGDQYRNWRNITGWKAG